MHRILTAIGAVDLREHDAAAHALYTTGAFQGEHVLLSLCCVGAVENREVRKTFLTVPQILWPQITSFIFQRFKAYFCQKVAHKQLDETGRLLWDLSVASHSVDEFRSAVQDRLKAS
jgi:hypothetical protein